MHHPALIFDGLHAFADIASAQCRAFNAAFEQGGLNWLWDAPLCASLSDIEDGEARIRSHADDIGETMSRLEVRRLNRAMIRAFVERAERRGVALQPGVAYRIMRAQDAGMSVGLASDSPLAQACVRHNSLGLQIDALAPNVEQVARALDAREMTVIRPDTPLRVIEAA